MSNLSLGDIEKATFGYITVPMSCTCRCNFPSKNAVFAIVIVSDYQASPLAAYMRAFQHLEDVDDDAADDAAVSAVATTPKELSPIQDNELVEAFSQFSLWSDTDALGKSLHPDLEERMYQLAQELEAGGPDNVIDEGIDDDVKEEFECPDSGPSIEVLGG
ncbi:hypothetical protein EDB80DRAFT_676605 [Ilyonectria destructans]|nr:hypothetical protein EDB80DRAFT_676605 [Ilyonectria destructans]